MESENIGDLIHTDGWLPWEGNFALNTLYYAEYSNTGPGASTDDRVKWIGRKDINRDEASKYILWSLSCKGHGSMAHLCQLSWACTIERVMNILLPNN